MVVASTVHKPNTNLSGIVGYRLRSPEYVARTPEFMYGVLYHTPNNVGKVEERDFEASLI